MKKKENRSFKISEKKPEVSWRKIMKKVGLEPLKADNKERFILDNQEAFRYGATEEFGMRDDHFEEDGEIISRATIESHRRR